MATFKIWGIGDDVRDQETLPFSGTVEYNNIEALIGHDINNHIDGRRSTRNLYENQENIFDFLEKFAKSSQENYAIYKNSLENALAFNTTTDITSIISTGDQEQTQFTVTFSSVNDLQSEYFDIHSPTTNYYVWFNIDENGINPGITYSESTTFELGERGVDFTDASEFNSTAAPLGNNYFKIHSTTTDYYIWFNYNSSGGDPDPDSGASTGIEIPISAGASDADIINAIVNTINTTYSSIFSATNDGGLLFTITNVIGGNVTNSTVTEISPLITINSSIDGIDITEATFSSYTGIEIGLNSSTENTTELVAQAINDYFDAEIDFGASVTGSQITITNTTVGNTIDTGTIDTTGFSFTNTNGDTGYKFYARIAPGIAFINGQIVIIRPQTYLAERQITKLLHLENWHPNPEEVIINYDYTNDKYQARITKRDGNGTLQTYTFVNGGIWEDFTTGYDTGIELLADIYNHSVFYTAFHYAVADDLTKITLEPTFELPTGSSVSRRISLMNDGTLELRTTTGDFDLHIFNVDLGQATDDEIIINSSSDNRIYFTNYNDFKTSLFLNVPNNLENTENITNPFIDDTIDYSNIINNNTFLTILNQESDANKNVIFGYAKDAINTIDTTNYIGADPESDGYITSTDNDVFYMNRDLVIRTGTNPEDWFLFSNIAASAGSGLPTVTSYDDLPTVATDGNISFVKNVNQLYRYNGDAGIWIPVSDPHKQFWKQTLQLNGNNADNNPTNTIYSFSGITWKEDGSNVNVYLNGLFQVQNSPGETDHEYTITDSNTITFNESLENTDTITVSVITGGENYYPEKIHYTVGVAQDSYTGSQFIFDTSPFELVRTKNDLFINGVLQRESTFITYAEETAGSNNDRIIDDTKNFTGYENYFVIIKSATNSANNYLVRKVDSVTTTTETGDTIILKSIDVGGIDTLPAITSSGDVYEISENYDYIINEDRNEIYTSIEIDDGAFIEIRDRASVTSTSYLINKGSSFPSNPIFAQEYYRTDLDIWYKFDGNFWIQIS